AEIKLGQLLAMTSGMQDGNGGVGFVKGENVKVDPSPGGGRSLGTDVLAMRAPLWTDPGGGYFYSNLGAHVLSVLVHRITGKAMQYYIREKLAGPMGLSTAGRRRSASGQYAGRGRHRGARHRYASVRVRAAAPGKLARPATDTSGIRGTLLQALAA